MPWRPRDASIPAAVDDDIEYALPFIFPFFGRNIVKINVNTNGLIELLEQGETCTECENPLTYENGEHEAWDLDTIFAANDDLITTVLIGGHSDRVEILWAGTTVDDNNYYGQDLTYKVVLFSDGKVQWKFFNMDYVDFDGLQLFQERGGILISQLPVLFQAAQNDPVDLGRDLGVEPAGA